MTVLGFYLTIKNAIFLTQIEHLCHLGATFCDIRLCILPYVYPISKCSQINVDETLKMHSQGLK